MLAMMLPKHWLATSAAAIAIAAHWLLLTDFPIAARAVAAFILANALPGALFIDWWLAQRIKSTPEPWERILYSLGAGYSFMIVVMLAISYLPGRIERWYTLAVFDLLIVILTSLHFVSAAARDKELVHDAADDLRENNWPPLWPNGHGAWLAAGLITLALIGGFLRFANLGYSEFQGDEARAVLRAAEVIQGDSDTLFDHKKGPAEILLPAALYSLTDRLNETTARFPFAFANFAALFALFLLGWRFFGPVAGWIAALLLALDGYFIGFARVVQYQSIVFFMVVLVMLVLVRLTRMPQKLPGYLTLAALFLATGLLAHYETALVLIPGAYLLYALYRRGVGLEKLTRALAAPVLVGGGILLSFYVLFVLNPRFKLTFAYIALNRIGANFPYNSLFDFFERATIYSTTYYFLLMVGCALIGLISVYRRSWPGWLGWLAVILALTGMALTFWSPTWLTLAGRDYTGLFFTAAMVAVWLAPRSSLEERLVWLWFGAPMALALFFVQKPGTHVYDFFIAWALLTGMVLARGWNRLGDRLGARRAATVALPVVMGCALLFGNYAYWYFAHTHVEVLRTWEENRPSGYWVPYSAPRQNAIFGFPLKNGWKVVGALYADGVLDAPFARNGKRDVSTWYTRGVGECARDHQYYIFTEWNEPANKGLLASPRRPAPEDGYQLFGIVLVNGQKRLEIYKRGGVSAEPYMYDVADYEARFDAALSGPIFEQNGPVANPTIQHPLEVRFGDVIWLRGYRLEQTSVAANHALSLTLYWQATAEVPTSYKVFTQVIDLNDLRKAGQRDGAPGCDKFPTVAWKPGDIVVDRYTIPIFADARPGAYALLIGLYDETDERLDVFTADGQVLGDSFQLTEITVKRD